jgi:hypothetical protein
MNQKETKMVDLDKQPTKEMLDEGVSKFLSHPILEADEDIIREALADAFTAMMEVSRQTVDTDH